MRMSDSASQYFGDGASFVISCAVVRTQYTGTWLFKIKALEIGAI